MNTDYLFDSYYYAKPAFVDGTTEFHALCATYATAGQKILEIGAGPTNPTSRYLSTLGPVIGIDTSAEVYENTFLTEAFQYLGDQLPFDNARFSTCVSNFVLEHIRDPQLHFVEIARVLRPGGVYCFRTPNLLHYVSLAAKLLPYSLHIALANRVRGFGKEAHDPYPTCYRANTRGRLELLARRAGLRVVEMRNVEKEPSYGRAHPTLFYPMLAYERTVNALKCLAPFRANIFAVLVRETR